MRPILCKGGFPVPVKSGKCEVIGICAPANNTAAASRLTLQDNDPYASLGNALPTESTNLKNVVFDEKGVASVDGNIYHMFKEPLVFVNGICLVNNSNLLPGRTIVYTR